MKVDNLFIVLAVTFFSTAANGQSFYHAAPMKFTNIDSARAAFKPTFSLQKDYYDKRLTFFCRQEWIMEKITGLTLRIRAGSLDQCNYLEGKK